MDLERAQQKAAELILDDEGWRDGIEDSLATPLLQWTLAQIDGRVAGAAESGALDENLPYAVADEARAMLRGVCDALRGFGQSHGATDAGDSVVGDGVACEPEAQG